MKMAKKLVLKASGYTVMILTLFYLFCLFTEYGDAYISLSTFGLILLFGCIISCADLIFKIKKIHVVLRVLVHYFVLLAAFFAVFIVSGNITTNKIDKIFVSIVIFTILYAIMFTIVYISRLICKKIDYTIDSKLSKKATEKSSEVSYKSLYGGDD